MLRAPASPAVVVTAFVILLLFVVAGPVTAAEPVVLPAREGVFSAFDTHPLVGIGEVHGMANEGEFYNSLIRDPRFAAMVGNVVVEFGGAAHQDILNRYLAGEEVPYSELRKVWSDVVGWVPTVTGVMYQTFFAQVRAVNQTLPPEHRIHIWLGEPIIDWTKIRTDQDLLPFLEQRDVHPAEIIQKEILAQGKKALVIYGAGHFNNFFGRGPDPLPTSLRALVEQKYPNAFFLIRPYIGNPKPECAVAFEAKMKWPKDVLVTPVKGTSVASALLQPGCEFSPPSASEMTSVQQQYNEIRAGVSADALLYLGPLHGLMQTPTDPTLWLDEAYSKEISRRAEIMGMKPLTSADYLVQVSRPPQPFWPR